MNLLEFGICIEWSIVISSAWKVYLTCYRTFIGCDWEKCQLWKKDETSSRFKMEQNKTFAALQKIYWVFGSVMSFDNLRQRGA